MPCTNETAIREPRKGFASRIAGFFRDRRGAAAVEFAFIAPILIGLYFMTMEISQAIEVNRKLNRLSGMVGDLVTQQTRVNPEDLEAIMEIGAMILQPYGRSQAEILVTGVGVTTGSKPKATVAWSARWKDGKFVLNPLKKDSEAALPSELMEAGSFLVRVEAGLDYRPVIAWSNDGKARLGLMAAFSSIGMGERFWFKPRMSPDVKCVGC